MWLRITLVLSLLSLAYADCDAQAPPTTQCVTAAVAGGTGDNITIPRLSCIPSTTLLILTISASNTTLTPTLTPVGGITQTVVASTGAPLAVGALQPGTRTLLNSNGTNWYVLSSLTNGSGVSWAGPTTVGTIPAASDTLVSGLKPSGLVDNGTVVSSTEPYSAIMQNVVPSINTGFGTPGILTTVHGATDGIVGGAVNDISSGGTAFATGVTGVGIMVPTAANNQQIFGLYGEADLAAVGIARGGEIDCMSYIPLGSGGRVCNGLLVGAGGTTAGDYGLIVAGAGGGAYAAGTPQRWTTGIEIGQINNPAGSQGSTNTWGLVIDGDVNGPEFGANINSWGTAQINLQLTTIGPFTPNSAVMQVVDSNDVAHFGIRQNGKLVFAQPVRPTLGACGTSGSVNRSNDQAGIITVGTGTVTSCTVVFNTPFGQVPSCVVTSESGMPPLWILGGTGPTQLVVGPQGGTANMAGFNFTYHCFDQP